MKSKMVEILLSLVNFLVITPLLTVIGFIVTCFMVVFFIVISIVQMGQLIIYFVKGEHKKAKWVNNGKKE